MKQLLFFILLCNIILYSYGKKVINSFDLRQKIIKFNEKGENNNIINVLEELEKDHGDLFFDDIVPSLYSYLGK